MAKQMNKKNEEIKIETNIDNTNAIAPNKEKQIKVSNNNTNAIALNKEEQIKVSNNNTDDLKNVNIVDLISYEKACALICKRYESAARIEYKDYKDKFNKYKMYYEKIFSEIENRVNEFCK